LLRDPGFRQFRARSLPGIRFTSTLISVDYEEPDEDRDQFSSWS